MSDNLTDEVVASFDGSPDPRTKEVLSALVRHLHAFAREVDLTEEEYFRGIDFLTRTGQISTATRQEFVLLADVLGLSMLTVGLDTKLPPEATAATVFGPFFVEGSPAYALGDDIANGAPGTPCLVSGRVLDTKGQPVAGALLETWQADDAVFGVKDSLIAEFTEHEAGTAPDGRAVDRPYATVHYDLVLATTEETL